MNRALTEQINLAITDLEVGWARPTRKAVDIERLSQCSRARNSIQKSADGFKDLFRCLMPGKGRGVGVTHLRISDSSA